MPHSHAASAHELGRDAGKPLAECQLAHALAASPQVADLDECLVVERALLERYVLQAVAFVHQSVELRRVTGQHFGLQHARQADKSVLAEAAHGRRIEMIRPV